MMKSLRLVILLLLIVFVSSVISIAGEPLQFKDFKGPTQILFGPVYTYSVLVEGSFEDVKWSATGGRVLKDWWEDRRFFCEVQWYENKPDDPAKLKVWGEDKESDKVIAERFFVSLQAKKRSLEHRSLRSAGGKCLDVHIEDLVKDGGRAQIWECNNEIQQRWKFDSQGRLVNEGGKCLDVYVEDLKKDGGRVQIWECNDQIQQKWKLDKRGRLVNGDGKCLDVDIYELNKDGGKVQIWECHYEENQQWKFVD